MAGDLTSGTIQAAVTIFPYQGQLLGAGMKDLGDPVDVAGTGGTELSAGWLGYQPWVAKNSAAIEAFNKAQDQALAWMKANPDAAAQVLVKDFKLPAAVAKAYPVTKFVNYDVSESYLSDWVAPMQAVGDLPANFTTSISDLVYKSN
jgi:NitT/TauT family transport system substrate-binding protein